MTTRVTQEATDVFKVGEVRGNVYDVTNELVRLHNEGNTDAINSIEFMLWLYPDVVRAALESNI